MKIHHLIDNLQVGGAETLVAALATLQRDAGNEVVVHGLFGGGPLGDLLQDRKIEVVEHRPAAKLALMARLYREFKRRRPDIVHCHNVTPTVVAALPARLARVAGIIATRHGDSSHTARRERKFWYMARLGYAVVAVSESARTSFAADRWARPEKLITIHNGALPPPAEPEAQPRAKGPGLKLISVARLHRIKDYPTLIRAFAAARRSLPGLELWIVGDGPERGALEGLITELGLESSATILGMRANVGYWLSQADIFVLSSISEGLPVSLLEAMAAGLPAVVTAVGGMPEVLAASGAGEVVPPSQPQALAEAILRLAQQRQKLPALGAAARRCYLERFTLARMAERYAELYRAAVSHSPLRAQGAKAVDAQ